MPQASLFDVVTALADQLRDALSSEDLPIQVEPGIIVNPTPVAIDIYTHADLRDDTQAGMGDMSGAYRLTVRARVTGDVDATQQILWDLMDDTHDLCLAVAIDDDPTLGGLAQEAWVESFGGFEAFGDLPGVTWTVHVLRAYS